MKELHLHKGYTTTVDDEDYDRVSKYIWKVRVRQRVKSSIPGCHVRRRFTDTDGHRKFIWLHHEILNIKRPITIEVDHIDGNGLNNQKSNLRICTRRENANNRHDRGSSKYPGTGFHKTRHYWHSQIRLGGRLYMLGQFKTELEAYTAYRVASVYHTGFDPEEMRV